MKLLSLVCSRRMYASIVAVSAIHGVSALDMVLAERGGAAEYAIVIPASADPAQRYAAEELRNFTERTTGVALPIKEFVSGGTIPSKAVVLAAGDGKDPALGEDGFRLRVKDGRLLVKGGSGRGTLYGVYEILERFAGCRWYSSWHSVVPKLKRISVPTDLDETHKPAIAIRIPYWYDIIKHRDFAARLRVNSVGACERGDPKYGGNAFRFGGGLGNCHTFKTLLPPERYAKSNPEYFSMIGGKRVFEKSQLCLTNPDVLAIVTSNVLARMRNDPTAQVFGVSQNDWEQYCRCPDCAAIDAEEESHAGTMVRFINKIAEAVEREFPDAVIETLAYLYTQKPPKKTKLRKNVMPCLCSISCDFSQPIAKSKKGANAAFRRDIEQWGSQSGMLYIWDYVTDYSNYMMPFANIPAMCGNIRFFRDNNAKVIFSLGDYQGAHAEFAELKAWLSAKLMWDPDREVEPLVAEFLRGFYGKAAPFVKEYLDKLQGAQSGSYLGCYASVWNPALTDEFLIQSASLLREAQKAVADDAAAAHNLRLVSFGVDYTRLERMRKAGKALVFADAVGAKSSPEEMQSLAKSLLATLDNAPDMQLCESRKRHNDIVQAWRAIVANPEVGQAVKDCGVVEERHLSLLYKGAWCDFADDALADDGKAVKVFNTHREWCVRFKMDNVCFAPKTRYRLRIRVRVEKASSGEAFQCGIQDSKWGCIKAISPKTDEISDTYEWYDLGSFTPSRGMYMWFAPGRVANGGVSPINGVWIDKLELSRVR